MWNNRIQEFAPSGTFIRTWGQSGKGPYGFYGPRAVSVGPRGDVYVADTGNRRIAVFNSLGRYLFQFGSTGNAAGQFEEPSSVFVGRSGDVYVTDMWNSRVQRFTPDGQYLSSWHVSWPSQSYLEPFGTTLPNGNIVLTDPTNSRILQFTPSGQRVGHITFHAISLPTGIATTHIRESWSLTRPAITFISLLRGESVV